MRREFSAGGIVFNNGQVLLVQTKSYRAYHKNGNSRYWGFPKGHIEKGQTTKEAALREVIEEGGVEAEIIEKIDDSKYMYIREGEKIFKVVIFFLMKYISGDIKDHDTEVEDVGWFIPEEVMEKLSFSQDKTLFLKALKLIENNKIMDGRRS